MKKILILGGTQFIGRNLVEKLLSRKDISLTLFNRQQNNSALFPELRKIKGDRETSDIGQLTKEDWDIVVDVSCYFPNSLETLLQKLKGKIGRYIFISTISVYDLEKYSSSFINESFETLPCSEKERRDTSMLSYGKRKAECERVLMNEEWLDKIILRPSIVYGNYDHTDRFYFWLYRIKHFPKFILPDNGKDKITLSYADDLADIIQKAIGIKEHSGIYNATTHTPLSLNEISEKIKRVLNSGSIAVNVPAEKIESQKIIPGKDIPLWFGQDLQVDNKKLINDLGMKFTSFEDSIRETIHFYEKLNWPEPKAGINEEKEREIISS